MMHGQKNIKKWSRENQNTYFITNKFLFPKIVLFMRQCGRI